MNKSCRVILLLLFFPFILLGQTDTVLFSSRGGFYDESFTLVLESQQGHRIRYTVNGETPTASSTLYNGPFLLDEQCFSRSNIHTIVNCIPSIYHAVTDVERVIVIRAAAFDDYDNCVSSIVTNTYIIKSLGSDTHGLPVVSIAADSLALFDYNTGIFVPGVNYDPADSIHTGNYYQRGIEWERRINVEFYETNNWGINQICGLRTHGGASRFYYELRTSVLSYDALKHIWDRYRSIVEEEIPRQSERFGFPKSVQRWQSDMDSTEAFFLKRSRAYEQELFELLSVEEVASLEFSVFPNPNKGVFYILLDTDENVVLPIEMFDCLGRRVYYRNSSFVGKTSVRVSAELPPGLYLLRVGHRSKRIVIQ
ncbi:MAG: chitobiase/beta-hexosaminidase C-terminal domain-containing protein [Bacteroidales bacterium]|nr:chitobiase/beta-hexosaminidase C-terminal domain-containing protein [Bacteroidales bacterium]